MKLYSTILFVLYFLTYITVTVIAADDVSGEDTISSERVQIQSPYPTTEVNGQIVEKKHEVTSFEWMGEDHLILSYSDGWVRQLSLDDHSLQDIAKYTSDKIILATSTDNQFLAIGTFYTIDIYQISETSKFSRSSSVHILYYIIESISWNKDNTLLGVTGTDALAAWYYGIVGTDMAEVDSRFTRGLSPVWHPERAEYAVISFASRKINISIFNMESEEMNSVSCQDCRTLQWNRAGRWLGAPGIFSEIGPAFFIIDTENLSEEAQPLLIGEGISNWCGSNQIITSNSKAIRLWDFDEGEVALSGTIATSDIRTARCSPSGNRIAAITMSGDLIVLENLSRLDLGVPLE